MLHFINKFGTRSTQQFTSQEQYVMFDWSEMSIHFDNLYWHCQMMLKMWQQWKCSACRCHLAALLQKIKLWYQYPRNRSGQANFNHQTPSLGMNLGHSFLCPFRWLLNVCKQGKAGNWEDSQIWVTSIDFFHSVYSCSFNGIHTVPVTLTTLFTICTENYNHCWTSTAFRILCQKHGYYQTTTKRKC